MERGIWLLAAFMVHRSGQSQVMAERPPEQEPSFLRERAAQLREMAAKAIPPSIAGQLLEVAADLDRRAAKLELASSPPQVT